MDDKVRNFKSAPCRDRGENFGEVNRDDPEQQWLEQAKQELLEALKMAHIRSVLRQFDLQDIITVLGESDVLDHIGVKRCLEFVQAVGFGPAGEDKRFCRERVATLAYSFECDS
jgi:hypothetical protein